MSIFKLNLKLSRPLYFYELQYVENLLNNPLEINKDYFRILGHLVSRFQGLHIQDLERLVRFCLLGEIETLQNSMDVDTLTVKLHLISNIPRIPVFVDDNLNQLIYRGCSADELGKIFQVDIEILGNLNRLKADELDEMLRSLDNLDIS